MLLRTVSATTLVSARIASSTLRWPQKQHAPMRKRVVPRAASISLYRPRFLGHRIEAYAA